MPKGRKKELGSCNSLFISCMYDEYDFHSQVLLTIEYMNILTGSHDRAYNFWTERLLHAIRSRSGDLAVDKAEECSIGIQLQPCMVYIIQRLQVRCYWVYTLHLPVVAARSLLKSIAQRDSGLRFECCVK